MPVIKLHNAVEEAPSDAKSYVRKDRDWVEFASDVEPVDHNTLLNMDGGNATERYHLTASQAAAATREATDAQIGLMSIEYATKVEASLDETAVKALITVENVLYEGGSEGITSITDLSGFINHVMSAGHLSGGAVTKNVDGTISVAAGEWMLRTLDEPEAPLAAYIIPAKDDIVVDENIAQFLIVDYNDGSPEYSVVGSTVGVSCRDKCIQDVLYRNGTTVDAVRLGDYSTDFMAAYAKKQSATAWMEYGGGLQISSTAYSLEVTVGALYNGVVRHSIPALSGAIDTINYWYRDGSGGFTKVTGGTILDKTKYDDGTGTLADTSVNKYYNHWVYLSVDNPTTLNVVYARTEHYTLSAARAGGVPSNVPEFCKPFSVGRLIGVCTIQPANDNVADIRSPFTQVFTSATPVSHNNLSGLNVGDDYVHLTRAEYNALIALLE